MARSINLRGLDKEVQENIEAKYDPQLEQKAMDWIAAITKQRAPQVKGCHGDALFEWLRSGVVLCDLLNSIRAGTVPTRQITRQPRHVLEERNNIDAYLQGCKKLGIPSQDMFILSDLHSRASISAVLFNIYALGRQAQVIGGFNGPRLGVQYNVSIEEQQRRLRAKEEEKERQREYQRAQSEAQLVRRTELEAEKREEIIHDMEENDARKLKRQLTRGTINKKQFAKLTKENSSRFQELRHSDTDIVRNSDIKYGMDIEIHAKRKEKYSHEREERAMDWIEKVTKTHIDDFHADLKSGVVLCNLVNTIYPGTAPNPNPKDHALVHSSNINMYLTACQRVGMKTGQLFQVSDLYDKKDLDAVLSNIFALGRKSEMAPRYNGPAMAVDGKIIPPNKKVPNPKQRRQCQVCSIQ